MWTFEEEDPFPSWMANRIGQILSLMADNLTITFLGDSITLPAGTDKDAAVVAIKGLWRYNEAPITVSHPGGIAGRYAIFVTTGANAISGDLLTDSTDYSFSAQIRAVGDTPPLTGGVAAFRQIGTCEWDGAVITSVTQTAPALPADPRIPDGAWTAWTPEFVTPAPPDGNGAVVIGSGSTLDALYYIVGRLCFIKVAFRIGTGFNGQKGPWSMSLPFPAAADAPFEQGLNVKLFCIASGTDFLGGTFVAPGDDTAGIVMPLAPARADLGAFQNAAAPGGGAGTGIPAILGSSPLTAGSNLIVWGSYTIDR